VTPSSAIKREMRARAMALRAAAARDAPGAGEAVARHTLAAVPIRPGCPASGYWPVGEELDIRPLLGRLHEAGHPLGLPVVVGQRRPLVFRRWRPGDALAPATLNIPVPRPEAGEIVPELVLVPLLAFDDEGYRLGYGGGFYDLTIAELRQRSPATLAVGVAYAAQRVEALPHEPYDQRLDWIVTERGARRLA
jgi:5-formyltetrahydrofolate cyclo-ligase